eukprot:6365725-Ditylum_brightwellii.AAC.1
MVKVTADRKSTSNKKYNGHFMPGGATVAPKADDDADQYVYNESKTEKGVKTKQTGKHNT